MAEIFAGAHVSAAGGVDNAPLNAKEIGANAFALFTGNPRGWSAPPLKEETIAAFKKNMIETAINPAMVLPHDTFLINMASPKEELAQKSYESFLDEAKRVEALGLHLLNFHPGSPSDSDPKQAMMQIASFLDRAAAETEQVIFVLEATAGQGKHLGRTFEELAQIIEYSKNPDRLGICIDTCHIFAAGYDIRTEESYHHTMGEFNRILGQKTLKGMHLNDSMKDLGSRVDRHQPLGQGFLGLEPFKLIARDPYMQTIPLILETTDPKLWPAEIAMLREFANN